MDNGGVNLGQVFPLGVPENYGDMEEHWKRAKDRCLRHSPVPEQVESRRGLPDFLRHPISFMRDRIYH